MPRAAASVSAPGGEGRGEFLKGKLPFDLRTPAAATGDLDLDAFLGVVRSSRAAVTRVAAVPIGVESPLPVIPRLAPALPEAPGRQRTARLPAPRADERDPGWAGLSPELVGRIHSAQAPSTTGTTQWPAAAPTPNQNDSGAPDITFQTFQFGEGLLAELMLDAAVVLADGVARA